MTDKEPNQVILGVDDLLPALSTGSAPVAPWGIPWITRMRNDSRRETVQSFTAFEEAINRHVETITRQVHLKCELMEANERALARLGKLETVRKKVGLEIDEELDELEHRAALRARDRDTELAQAEARLNRARREADEVSAPQTSAPTFADQLRDAFQQVQELGTAFDAHIDEVIARGGGTENDLPDDAQRHIDTLRTLKANKIGGLYDRLAQYASTRP